MFVRDHIDRITRFGESSRFSFLIIGDDAPLVESIRNFVEYLQEENEAVFNSFSVGKRFTSENKFNSCGYVATFSLASMPYRIVVFSGEALVYDHESKLFHTVKISQLRNLVGFVYNKQEKQENNK